MKFEKDGIEFPGLTYGSATLEELLRELGVIFTPQSLHDPNATPGSYTTVLITWGDGQQSNGTVVADPNGGFDVLAEHTYAEEGSYPLQVFIADLSLSGFVAEFRDFAQSRCLPG